MGGKVIYFNKDTNTIYYEFNIVADPDTPLADPLEIGSSSIYFDRNDFEGELISLSSAKIEAAETISLQETQLWGGMNLPDDLDLPIEVLKPGHYGICLMEKRSMDFQYRNYKWRFACANRENFQ